MLGAGQRIRFRLYAGREVVGVIRGVLKTVCGLKYAVEYGNNITKINPEQVTYPKPKPKQNIKPNIEL
jgi:hypothetical protein